MAKKSQTLEGKKATPVMDVSSTVLDGIQNFITGLGVNGLDKRKGARYCLEPKTFDQLAELYRASDLAATIVDKPAEDMTREGWYTCISDKKKSGDAKTNEDAAEALDAMAEDLEIEAIMEEALRYKRLYGGSAVLIGANDSQLMDRPLNEEGIKAIDYLTVFDPWEVRPVEWEENPLAKGFSKPTFFTIQPHGSPTLEATRRVHASRLLIFQGTVANRLQLRLSNPSGLSAGWGDSVLLPVVQKITDYDQSWDGVSHLLTEFAQAVIKMEGLESVLLSDKDDVVRKRFSLMNYVRSLVNVTMIGEGEEFKRETTSVAGVPETLREFQARVAAAAKMPVNVLFGTSPGGLGSNGSSEMRVWYDVVKAMQRKQLAPQLRRLMKLLLLSKEGPTGGREPENWAVKFHPLWQLSDVEKADVRNKNANTDKIYHDLGVASTEDIARSRFGGDEYGMDLDIDEDALEEREEQEAEMRDVTHETTVSNLEEHGSAMPPKPGPMKPGAKEE